MRYFFTALLTLAIVLTLGYVASVGIDAFRNLLSIIEGALR